MNDIKAIKDLLCPVLAALSINDILYFPRKSKSPWYYQAKPMVDISVPSQSFFMRNMLEVPRSMFASCVREVRSAAGGSLRAVGQSYRELAASWVSPLP